MPLPCEQHDKIKHIEEDLTNHKAWRKDTTRMLSDIQVICATTEERLKNKLGEFDRHIAEGNAFRLALIGTMVSVGVVACASFVAYGRMEQKVDMLYGERQEAKK